MPEHDGNASLTVQTKQFQYSETNDGLSRSPHPYHRRGPSLSRNDYTVDPSPPTSTATELTLPNRNPDDTYFDADHRKRGRSWDLLDDSGTEGDDEKGAFLLRLPAPAARPRKGLKGGQGVASPLLTPSYLDDEERRASLEAQAKQQATQRSQSSEVETAKLREKFRRRRRAEVIRRATETALFLMICYVVMQARLSTFGVDSFEDEYQSSNSRFWKYVGQSDALPIFAVTVSGLYALYPARIILHNHALSAARHRSRFYIHLPAAFDPAPLLYPVFMPVLVAWLIGQASSLILLPNLILGLSSIPSKIIPLGDLAWYGSPHWIISALPAVGSHILNRVLPLQSRVEHVSSAGGEILMLLYPLHQTLLPVLQYLTTTSLLATELQLLSVALINLYLLSESPQAIMLKIIFWIGAVSLLLLCNKVLSTGVAIARIPSWRFRRSRSYGHTSHAFIEAIHDCFRTPRERFVPRSENHANSADGEALGPLSHRQEIEHRLSRLTTIEVDIEPTQTALHKTPSVPTSVKDDVTIRRSKQNGSISESSSRRDRHRSNTLPALPSQDAHGLTSKGAGKFELSNAPSARRWSLRSMTATQATTMRRIMAAYFYTIALGLIFVPVRQQIRHQALHDLEPVGWALSYLFGDLTAFRNSIHRWNFESWVPLRCLETPPSHLEYLGLAERLRHYLGFANTRLLICAYALAMIVVGLALVLRLSTVAEVDTRRKVFHGMMVAMFLPTTYIDPPFIALAFIVVLVVFLLLDLIRASQLPPLAKPITHFLAPYVDGRDHRGPVIVSHIFLLIGCAIPLWLSLAALPRIGIVPWEGWEVPTRDLSMVSGIVCVGMGDAAASLIGRRYGRRRWCWLGGKSLEGSFAFASAVVIGLSLARFWLLLGGWEGDSGDPWLRFWVKATMAGGGASLTEAVLTGGNDNVVVPVILWLLVKGLGI